MRYYHGYMTKPGRKVAFEVRAASKTNAMRNMKEDYPDWRVHIVKSTKKSESGAKP